MMLTKEQMAALVAPLNAARVKSRSQGGRSLSYLEAWDVKATLVRVFGFGGFSAETTSSEIIKIETDIPKRSGQGTTAFRVTAMCTVRLTIHGRAEDGSREDVIYTDSAVAAQSGADPGEVADFAVKTASSDALKRCAIHLGTQFGLSLYNDGSVFDVIRVVLEPGQAEVLAEVRKEQEEQFSESKAQLAEQLARATGQEPAAGPTSEEGA